MKRIYLTPASSAQHIQYNGVLMASGDRVSGNIDIHGGDNSGDVQTAF
ncbi:MAG: hypothetical protein IJQ32_08190 [Paludibacteraceae bacterium]|nr:hypothetical protein [Paludibacteraceae bacterium]